ncbi:DUF423 domain-containing protein [Cytophagales bacterium LB-30]|uniref:DUF423 domain-containing protein n=1 Tax=Shiella aurantiaca TaxID=3058365 RepID=A0ABT8F1B8_9BACT|nr:DUF423 domain-containing protein [Shiella aurantiaca]MDN4164222.1 DUF423 domain-containing protein [Shiella aurantiaca]
MKSSKLILLACLLGGSAVAIGAFGAHGLKELLQASGRADTFETAVRYKMYHALVLLAMGIYRSENEMRRNLYHAAAWAFGIGILIFSGSLYVLCLTGITWLGAITPLGGLGLIAGWILLALSFMKGK